MSEEKSSILLLSTSSEIAESVHSILDNEYNLIRAKSLTQSFEILNSQRPPIAILDFAVATSMNGDTLAQLKKHKPNLVTLLICPRDKRDQLLESNLSNETYRVLFATLSPGQTRLAVAAALKHAKVKASEEPITAKTEKQIKKATKPNKVRSTGSAKKPGSKLMPIIAGIGVLALAGIGWMFMSGEKNVATPEPVKIEKTAAQLEAENLSLSAKASFDSGLLFPPDESNALDMYSKILQLDPNSFAAKKGLVDLSQLALDDVDLHIQNGNIGDAQASMNFARELGANNPAFLELVENTLTEKKSALIENIEETLANGAISDAASLVGVANSLFSDDEKIVSLNENISEQQNKLSQATEISNLLSRSRDAINANRLLSPTSNNANYFINRLEDLDSSNSGLTSLKRDLSNALLLEARSLSLDSDFVNAKRYVDSAASLGSNSAAITIERQRITSLESKIQEQQLADVQAANDLAEEQLLAETERLAQEQAAEAKKAEEERQAEVIRLSTVPVDVVIGDLKSLRKTPPNYPSSYERRRLAGAATIAFTLQKDGSVSNVRVVSVDPESRIKFGNAAQEAVEQWIFEPYQDDDGNVRIANSQIRIVFQL